MAHQCSLPYRDLILRHFVDETTKCDHKHKGCAFAFNMSKFIPNKEHSRTALIFCFHLKKTAAESYRLLREAYGEHAPSQDTCERWFQRFKNGNFDVADKKRGKPPKKYEDAELQALLNEDGSHTQKQLAEQLGVSQQAVSSRLREMRKKTDKWVPHKFNNRQMEMRKNIKNRPKIKHITK